jgi:putative transcriptional regulator
LSAQSAQSIESPPWPKPAASTLTNQFLIAMPGMADGTFTGAVVYLCEHTEKGALGLVINKPIDIKLKNLFEKVELSLDRDDLAEAPVYFGGPVQTERGFVLHERQSDAASPYSSTLSIPGGGLDMTTSKDVLEALSHGAGPKKILVTLGYSGWGRRPTGGRDRPQRLAHRRRASRSHLRHAGRAALRPRTVAARDRPAHAEPGGGARMSAARAAPAAAPSLYLAFDYGSKRVGVASGNDLTRTATPLATIAQPGDDARFAAIGRLVTEWRPRPWSSACRAIPMARRTRIRAVPSALRVSSAAVSACRCTRSTSATRRPRPWRLAPPMSMPPPPP